LRFNKKVIAGVAVLAAAGGGILVSSSADAATTGPSAGQGSVTGWQIKDGTIYGADINPDVVKWFTGTYDNTVTTKSVKDGALTEADLSPAVKAKLNAVGTGGVGPAGPQGPKGDKGEPGDSAIVSVTAATALTDRPDSGAHGDWALDSLTRSVAITRQAAVEASKCGTSAMTCWFYTGTLIDNGTFTTIDGAKSPDKGTAISGTVQGSVVGGSKFQFYASSDAPNPVSVPGTSDGAANPTAKWPSLFFPAGTAVTDADLLDWSWTYEAQATCEKWVNAKAGNR
jgi:hypothetical protein